MVQWSTRALVRYSSSLNIFHPQFHAHKIKLGARRPCDAGQSIAMDMCEKLDREDGGPMVIPQIPLAYARSQRQQATTNSMMRSIHSDTASIRSTSTTSSSLRIPDVAAGANGCISQSLSAASITGRHAVVLMTSNEELKVTQIK